MNRTVVIIIAILWVLCAGYAAAASMNGYPYASAAMVMAWVASGLLLLFIIIFLVKHKAWRKEG